jgi:hypothetical protein
MTACAHGFVAVVLIIAGTNALRAQTSEIANKTVIITNGVVTQYWYIAPSGRIYASATVGGPHGYSNPGQGDEYEIGKTIGYQRSYRTAAGGKSFRCKETTNAGWSPPTLTLTKLSRLCDGYAHAMALSETITIQFNGGTCTAKVVNWSKAECRVASGRQLP